MDVPLGYGVGFPKNSMWIPKFNEYLMRYRENGDLERMQRFWFTGACEPRKRRRTSSKPLALAQVLIILKLCNAVVKDIKPYNEYPGHHWIIHHTLPEIILPYPRK